MMVALWFGEHLQSNVLKINFHTQLFIIIFVFFCGCQNNAKSNLKVSYDNQIRSYLFNAHNINLDSILSKKSKTTIFVIQVDMCGSCTKEKKEEICIHGNQKDNNLIIILSKTERNFENQIDQCAPNSLIINDFNKNLERHGLRLSENLILEYENFKIQNYDK